MASPPTTLLCQYRYDPLDRLIHQTQPDTPVHERFYCKSRLATEIQGAKYSIVQHDDLLLAQQQRDGDALDTTLLSTDLQRSVLHTLKKDHPRHPIAYSPYGHRPALSGLLSLLGFNGERPDPVTGHYLLGNGYRAFNPLLMRFNSPDSWSPFGKGGLNTYAYCFQNPILIIDPDGHAPLALSTFLYKLNLISKASYQSKILSKITRLRDEILTISLDNGRANIDLRDSVYKTDFLHAQSHRPKQVSTLQAAAARKLTASQISMLPSKIKNSEILKPDKNYESGRLFPLYREIADSPSGTAPERYAPWKLKELMTGNTPLPDGISMEDVNNFHRRINLIRNPHHDQNESKINALDLKEWKLVRQRSRI